MNHKLKRRWVAALRGGTWTQIKDDLVGPDNGRCALGVLNQVKTIDEKLRGSMINDLTPENYKTIICLNDYEGKTFNEIADWIEENL